MVRDIKNNVEDFSPSPLNYKERKWCHQNGHQVNSISFFFLFDQSYLF